MKRVLMMLIAGTVLSGVAAVYATVLARAEAAETGAVVSKPDRVTR